MKTAYGEFEPEQFDEYKRKLHAKMFWLLIYKDPATCKNYTDIHFDKYFQSLLKEINGLNDVLLCPPELIEVMSLLRAAYNESLRDPLDYAAYRKLVLDAHNALDRIGEVQHDND